MKTISTRLALYLGTAALLAGAGIGAAQAADVERHGTAYVVYLPEGLDYHDVVDRLKTEILAQNWEITDEQDVGVGMRMYNKATQNMVISVCKSQLLAQAVVDDPFITLVVPCRFTVFREKVGTGEETGKTGRIVVGFSDPVEEAKSVGVKNYQGAQVATDDLKAVLQRIADLYSK